MISAFFSTLGDVISGYLTALVSAFSGVTEIFYSQGELTIYGQLLIVGLGIAVVGFAIAFITRLVRK